MTNSSRLLLLAAVFMLAPLACSDALDDTPKVVDESTETDELPTHRTPTQATQLMQAMPRNRMMRPMQQTETD